MDRQILTEILKAGVRAPSADNLQPWKFIPAGDSIELHLDRTLLSNFCDNGYLMPYLSAGAVIENIRVAAAKANYQIRLSYLPDPDNPLFAARITFSPGSDHLSLIHYEAIEQRRTNRKMYRSSQAVPVEILEGTQRMAKEAGMKIRWFTRSDAEYPELVRMVGEADRIRFESPRLHRELFALLRFSESEVRASQDGLDLRGLEAGPGSEHFFRLIQSWDRLSLMNRLGLSAFFDLFARGQMKSSPAAGFIYGDTAAPADYIKGGELVERIWHELTLKGLSIQPMEALPIFILNFQLNGCAGFSDKHKAALSRLKHDFFNLYKITDDNAVLFLFRAGYAAPPSVTSPRREIETFLGENANSKV